MSTIKICISLVCAYSEFRFPPKPTQNRGRAKVRKVRTAAIGASRNEQPLPPHCRRSSVSHNFCVGQSSRPTPEFPPISVYLPSHGTRMEPETSTGRFWDFSGIPLNPENTAKAKSYGICKLERAMRFELTTLTLARPELPRPKDLR
jgi:hypothetical protein